MKILHLADIHYDLNKEHLHYEASKEMVIKLFNWLIDNRSNYDLIAISGDITVKGTTYIAELAFVKDKFDKLDIPYIIVPGNHDLCPLKGMEKRYPDLEEYEYKELEKTNFYKVFGENGVRFNKVVNDIQLIGFAIRNDDPDNALDWLIEALNTPHEKLVFCHYPIIPTRISGFCSTWDYFRIENSLTQLNNIIFDKKNKVLGYFCGHQHINSIIKVNNCYHIETASAVLGSCSYRTIDISATHISVSTNSFNNPDTWVGDLTAPERSYDINHETSPIYHRGNKNDLIAIIERESL